MELPDEAIQYDYRGLLAPTGEEWTAAAELRARYFVHPSQLKDLVPRLVQCRSQVVAEREIHAVPAGEPAPLAGFIDLPQQTLDQHRRKGDESPLGRILRLAARLREDVDQVVILGVGGSHHGSRALFQALRSAHHNLLPAEARLGVPRLLFEGFSPDNDSLQDLLEVLQVSCVDPDKRNERWAVVVVSKSGVTLEPLAALRIFDREATEYYGLRSPWLERLFVAVTGPGSPLAELFAARGLPADNVLEIPANVGGRYSVFTAAGLLPAALMGLDVRALLLGAAAMTKRFLEEPFERNPVLQLAGLSYLTFHELRQPLRVLSVWSPRLEGLGLWYDHLVAAGLSKQGQGPTPLTMVQTRDLHTRGQQDQEGPRDRVITNLLVRSPATPPLAVGMADHNQDDLNRHCRKAFADLMRAGYQGMARSLYALARPSADLILPTISEHTMGQLMQLLMLATVVEARLMGISPYTQPGVDACKRHMREALADDEQDGPAV